MEHTYLNVPYIGCEEDVEGNVVNTREWLRLHWLERVDKRHIKRYVRRWVRENLGRRLHTEELRAVLKNVRYETTQAA